MHIIYDFYNEHKDHLLHSSFNYYDKFTKLLSDGGTFVSFLEKSIEGINSVNINISIIDGSRYDEVEYLKSLSENGFYYLDNLTYQLVQAKDQVQLSFKLTIRPKSDFNLDERTLYVTMSFKMAEFVAQIEDSILLEYKG